jgi:5-formyltetrahydrofolate cyclo-ligase
MEMVRLADFEDYMSLPVTKWNIKQPKDDEFREEALDHGLDMMLVPGMAFTVHGERLGRGKGYYDTYLSKAESKAISPLTVALAFQEQILTELPVTEHDKLIDKVIFPGK